MDIGLKWSSAILTWISIEINASFVAMKLGTSKQPACISAWIQCAHAPAYWLTISCLDKFESDFLAWWTSLQPEWR